MDDLLFYRGGELRDALEGQRQKMRRAIDAEPEENLLQADVDEWVAALAHHFAIACPELRKENITRDPPADTTVDVSRDQMRAITNFEAARRYPGYRHVIHVPFEGEADVLKFKPNTFSTSGPPRGRVRDGELIFTIEHPRDQAIDIDAQAHSLIAWTEKYLGFAQQDIDVFNAGLEQEAKQVIQTRRRFVEQRDAQLAKSTIPVRRPGESGTKTYLADVLVRRPAPLLPRTRADDKPPKLEPALPDEAFDHILGVIRKQCLHIEQNPRTYVPMGEEDRRNVILSALTTHYDGFTAETDNQGGHTDILARQEGRNVFICECKFWSGQDGFTKTIDQLFGYTGWRDTKLAIVMFVREKGLTAILKKAKTTLAEHPQFISWKDAAGQTELRAEMSWPGDPERRADLNVFFAHTQEAKN
jgi:hypothetical protein